jgi:uncharacterized protein YjiS (DUF1127 family)
MSDNGIFLDAMFGYVRTYRNALRRQRAERVLNNLPAHLRKDIGWPDSDRFFGEK